MTRGVEFARLSPVGRGAILVVELRGDGRRELLSRLFTGSTHERVSYGRFVDSAGVVIDDGLCVTLDESVLLTLHGNPVLVDRLLAELQVQGATEVPPVFPQPTGTTLEREVLELLPHTRTGAAAEFLLAQADPDGVGLAAWRHAVLAGEITLDVPDLDALLARAPIGRGLLEPARVLLAGVPNAGKSTLFNLFLGHDRVVTHASPGTTRDLIEEVVPWGAFPVLLMDGAGLRASENAIEQEGVRRMQSAIAAADVVVLMEPGEHVGHEVDRKRVREEVHAAARRVIEIHSRSDEYTTRSDPELLTVSGSTGHGVRELEQRVLIELWGTTDPPAAPTPFLARHETVLKRCRDARQSGGSLEASLREL